MDLEGLLEEGDFLTLLNPAGFMVWYVYLHLALIIL